MSSDDLNRFFRLKISRYLLKQDKIIFITALPAKHYSPKFLCMSSHLSPLLLQLSKFCFSFSVYSNASLSLKPPHTPLDSYSFGSKHFLLAFQGPTFPYPVMCDHLLPYFTRRSMAIWQWYIPGVEHMNIHCKNNFSISLNVFIMKC